MSIPDRGDDARKEVRANGAQPCCPANNFVDKRRWSDLRDGRKNSPPIQLPAQDRLPCQSRRAQAAQDSDLNFLSRMIPLRAMAFRLRLVTRASSNHPARSASRRYLDPLS